MKKYLAYYETEWPANIAELTAVENKPFVGYLKGLGVSFTVIPAEDPIVEGPADNEIWYTVRSESVKYPANRDQFDVSIVNNTYEDGRGIMTFDGPITRIKDSAFDFDSFTSITLPKSLRVVENHAFIEASIGEVYFMGTLLDWLNITFGDNPMLHAGTLYINGTKIEELVIPDGVTSIRVGAFSGCNLLTSVTIPNSVTSIGDYAFEDCSSLTSITIPESVTSIGDEAFLGCSSLTSIVIPDGVTSIGEYAFSGCSALTSITIPDGVTSIGAWTFGRCAFTSIVIPNSVTSIGYKAFYDCSKLDSITFEGTMEQWNSIVKGSNWNYKVPATHVQCSDGQVTL